MIRLAEEQLARAEEARLLTAPIAGIENNLWFDYRLDITEAQKELASDLRRASDLEDRRDAWEEYARELKHEREDYIHDMAKRGYRQGTVYIEGCSPRAAASREEGKDRQGRSFPFSCPVRARQLAPARPA